MRAIINGVWEFEVDSKPEAEEIYKGLFKKARADMDARADRIAAEEGTGREEVLEHTDFIGMGLTYRERD